MILFYPLTVLQSSLTKTSCKRQAAYSHSLLWGRHHSTAAASLTDCFSSVLKQFLQLKEKFYSWGGFLSLFTWKTACKVCVGVLQKLTHKRPDGR